MRCSDSETPIIRSYHVSDQLLNIFLEDKSFLVSVNKCCDGIPYFRDTKNVVVCTFEGGGGWWVSLKTFYEKLCHNDITSASLVAIYMAMDELLYHNMDQPAKNPAIKPWSSLSLLRTQRNKQLTIWKLRHMHRMTYIQNRRARP